MTKILSREMGVNVVCAGTYCKHDGDWFREQVNGYCDEILITDNHTEVGDMIARIEPQLFLAVKWNVTLGNV
jgi:Nitrogenase component 1 type Oxidoreductase.